MAPFYKMQATGNDFVFFLESEGVPTLSSQKISELCSRKFGIGADGLVVLKNKASDSDLAWLFYNADGGEAEMCGNAARCALLLLQEKFGPKKRSIKTRAGQFSGSMADTEIEAVFEVPEGKTQELHNIFSGRFVRAYFTNTGVPHCVIPVENPHGLMDRASELAPFIFAKEFSSAGSNLTFVDWNDKNLLQAVTLERGVNDFTLSCGTGVIAAAKVFSELNKFSGWTRLKTPGGILSVYFEPGNRQVKLRGPAALVYKGEI